VLCLVNVVVLRITHVQTYLHVDAYVYGYISYTFVQCADHFAALTNTEFTHQTSSAATTQADYFARLLQGVPDLRSIDILQQGRNSLF